MTRVEIEEIDLVRDSARLVIYHHAPAKGVKAAAAAAPQEPVS